MDQIAGPIGINIGSKSPEEIALATCAEIKSTYAVRATPEETRSTTKKNIFT
jgi:xanthine/CO dehydrogenase XdhC/CoxF family maturation factor